MNERKVAARHSPTRIGTPFSIRLTRLLLWAAVGIWSVWVGGQVFNAMMVVPIWSVNPPETLRAYANLAREARGLPFFIIFTTLWPLLLSSVACLTSRGAAWSERRWIVLFAAIALGVSLALVGWLVPTIAGLFAGQYTTDAEGARAFRAWERGNVVRLGIESINLLIGLRALIGSYR